MTPLLALLAVALAAAPLPDRLKQFNALLDEQWEYTLRTNPEFASILGDKRFNDRITDFSEAFIEKDIAQQREFLQRFKAVDASGFAAPGTFSLAQSGSSIVLGFTPVPEPAAVLGVCALATTGWVGFWRRRWAVTPPRAIPHP